MYENDSTPIGETLYEEIPQTPIQPMPEEAPAVAEAASGDTPSQKVQQSNAGDDVAQRERQRRYTEEQQERNFAELRRLQEQKDRELELMRREIDQLRQSQYKPQPKDEFGLPKDALAEVQQVEKIVEARLRERDEQYRRQLEQERQVSAERALNAQYKDLYQVLSTENLRRLEQEEPEIAASIASNPDVYSAKIAAYKQIKKLGISEESYNQTRVNQRLAENNQRPKNPAALAPRQGSQALAAAPTNTGFAESITEDMASRYRKEMEDAIRGM